MEANQHPACPVDAGQEPTNLNSPDEQGQKTIQAAHLPGHEGSAKQEPKPDLEVPMSPEVTHL